MTATHDGAATPVPSPTGTPVREEPDDRAPTPAEMDQRVHDARR